jgi:hypothetical protein
MKATIFTFFKNFVFVCIYITLFIIPLYLNFSIKDLDSPYMFQDEICSYNGMINTDKSNVTWINCTCQDEFANDKSNPNKIINGVPVQCSYEKKRRFIALFLAIFLPFGVDYLYLGRYAIFVLTFLLCWITLIGNCFRFAVSSHTDYLKNRKNLLFISLAILMFIWWILNIVLIWTGIVTDGNGVETVNDLYFLININNN